MNYQLIAPRDPSLSMVEQVLINRGIGLANINHYLNTTNNDILNPSTIDRIDEGVRLLMKHIAQGSQIFVTVDADCDGYTSAAVLLNYLYRLFPGTVENNFKYDTHPGKQHGINLSLIPKGTKLVIYPDSASSDYTEHELLSKQGIDILIIDHHQAEKVSEYACVINNQLCDYPTKSLSGVGMVFKFCSYMDKLFGTNYAMDYIDLVSLGMTADLMSLRDFETKHLINLGLENIKNPFFKGMTIKNAFSLGEKITSFGVAFYVAPYINAVTRCGTQEDKIILFESMLEYKALDQIPSTKRGCKGMFETKVEQACRNCTNVKNRQGKSRDASLELIQQLIHKNNLLDNKIIFVTLNKSYSTDKNLTGLVATKIANDYQRPTLILNETLQEDGSIVWQGSGRNYNQNGFEDLRGFLLSTSLVEYCEGHENAFGLGVTDRNLPALIAYTNEALKDFDFSAKYKVDFEYDAKLLNPDDILNLADFDHLWGKDIEEPLVLIKNVPITEDTTVLLKDTTIKITLPNSKITLIKFHTNKETYDLLVPSSPGKVTIDIVGRFVKNEWMGNISPQVIIEDYGNKSNIQYNF